MGFIQAASGALPDFDKAVISLWVRIPQASLNAVAAAAGGDGLLAGYLPFATFGQAQTQEGATATFTPLASAVNSIDSSIVYTFGDNAWTSSGSYQVAPTFIGACVFGSSDSAWCSLAVSIQLPVAGECTGVHWTIGRIDCDAVLHSYTNNPAVSVPTQLANMVANPGTYVPFLETWTAQDITSIKLGGAGESFSINTNIQLDPDRWHHILVSFDISGTCTAAGTQEGPDGSVVGSPTASTSCKIWVAVDDVNYTGADLRGSSSAALGLGPNDFLADHALLAAYSRSPANVVGVPVGGRMFPSPRGSDLFVDQRTYTGYEAPAYAYAPQKVASAGKPTGIPASSEFATEIFKIEMAEFQMFTGVTLNTADQASRRAFIDASHKPVAPNYPRTKDGVPNPRPSPPVALLGKEPDIAFTQSSGNWISGRNIAKQSAAPFGAAGTIKPFTPDPELGK